MTLYILQNQYGQYLTKQEEWSDGGDRDQLYRTPNRDEALNLLIEINAKDIELRGRIIDCEGDTKGRPVLPQPAAESDAA